VESAPRAYKLKASNAAPPISTIAGTSRKDKQVATYPRRFTVVEPPPFAMQFLEAERPKAIDLALDRSGIRRSHG
jgi:hypothetical protein